MPRRRPSALRRLVLLTCAAAVAIYVAGRALPALGEDGHLVVRWWGALALYAVGGLSCLVRAAVAEPRQRLPWALLGAGILLFGAGSLAHLLSGDRGAHVPAAALVGWLALYPLGYAALLLLMRERLRPFTLSLSLDGLLGGLTLAAVCAAIVRADIDGIPFSHVLAGLAYPVADVLLLVLALWGLAATGWRDRSWLVMSAALAALTAGDIAVGVQVARDHYEALSAASATYPIALVGLGAAAWFAVAPRRPPRPDALAVLVLPAACAAAILAVLALDGSAALPRWIGLVALVVIGCRAALGFRELSALQVSRRFERGFEEAAIGMAIISEDLRWVRVNAKLAQMLGRGADELRGAPILASIHPDDHHLSHRIADRLLAGAPPPPPERRLVSADGTVIDVVVSAVLIEGEDGAPQFFSQFSDVTGRRRSERHAEALAELSRVALDLHDADELAAAVCAGVRDAMPADACVLLPPGAAPGAASGPMLTAPVRRRATGPATLTAHRRLPATGFHDQDVQFLQAAANLLGTALDRASIEGELREQALTDPLTGLANRSFLAAHLEHATAAAARGGEVALLLLDLDRFKVVNDTLGHRAGDELLRVVAERLRAAVRPSDVVARLGGDEFVVAWTAAQPEAEELPALAQRVLDAIAAPCVVDGQELHVTASAGLAVSGSEPATAETLLRDADVAMYRAKEHGGAGCEVFDAGLRARVVRRMAIEGELRRAIEADELRLHLQPVVDLATFALTGFEALVRWEHPERGLIGPDEFVGVAEETGLVVPLGRWVLQEATSALAELQARTSEPLRMAVNLSARQLTPALVADVRAAAAAAGVRPRDLTLEVTETLLVDGAAAVDVLTDLRAMGVAIALDDFGTGWSSLGALQRHPVDVLKLDRSLVAPAAASPAASALVRAAVEMARALGLLVVAEGIEDAAQLQAMQALACPRGQGFLFSRPMPLAEALEIAVAGAIVPAALA
ncbi:MAG TPA: EAL domain-containing protein [Baekduia sp.]|nr:EAL domain-containing protein [Baekduia sp.]